MYFAFGAEMDPSEKLRASRNHEGGEVKKTLREFVFDILRVGDVFFTLDLVEEGSTEQALI
jgi:hypothetical protein